MGIALPPHLEYRTLPMLFYVPPLSPVMAGKEGDSVYHLSGNLFHDIDESRIPIEYLANLLGAGNEAWCATRCASRRPSGSTGGH